MTTKTKKKRRFMVAVLRADGETVIVHESTNGAAAKKSWEKHFNNWKHSGKEAEPFVVETKESITAIQPAMVQEIKLVSVEMESSRANSPYNQNMSNIDMIEVFKQNTTKQDDDSFLGGDLLDGGYN